MNYDELDKEIERTLERNQAAIQRANRRSERLTRAAERSNAVLERAFTRLRQSIR
jgi:hypothetical protein